MLRSLLVGLDGSDESLAAVDLSIRWAKQFDCLVVGVGVVDEPAIRGAQPAGHVNRSYQAAYDTLLAEDRREVEHFLERFAFRCSDEQVACKLLEDEGHPCEQILLELQRYDVLIVGRQTHFRHGSQDHPCKTLENVLRHASRPVVVAPQSETSGDGTGIVVAYDGSVQAARAVQGLLATGLTSLGAIEIVCVHPSSSVEAARTADRAVEFLRFHNVEATRVPIVGGSPAELFLEHAHSNRAELIVMGAYGQARVKEMFFGSATCRALENSKIPMLLCH